MDNSFRALAAIGTNRQAMLYRDVRIINNITGVARAAIRDFNNFSVNERENIRNDLRTAFGVRG